MEQNLRGSTRGRRQLQLNDAVLDELAAVGSHGELFAWRNTMLSRWRVFAEAWIQT